MKNEEIAQIVDAIQKPIREGIQTNVNGKIDKMRAENQAFHEERIQSHSAMALDIKGIYSKFDDITKCISKLENWRWFVVGCTAVILILVPVVYYSNVERINKVELTTDNLKSTTVTKEDLQNFKDDIKGLLQTYTSQISKQR